MVLKSLKDFPMVPQVITKEAQFTADSSIIMSYTSHKTHALSNEAAPREKSPGSETSRWSRRVMLKGP